MLPFPVKPNITLLFSMCWKINLESVQSICVSNIVTLHQYRSGGRGRGEPSDRQHIVKEWIQNFRHFHHHHLSLNCEGRWGTTVDFTTSFLHFSMFSTALWDLLNSRPVHSLMLSSHLFLCLPYLLPPFTVPSKMILTRPDEQETWSYHCSLRPFTMVRRSSCGLIAFWILARTSSLVTGILQVTITECVAVSHWAVIPILR